MPFGGEPNGVVMMMLEHCSRQIQCVIETVVLHGGRLWAVSGCGLQWWGIESRNRAGASMEVH